LRLTKEKAVPYAVFFKYVTQLSPSFELTGAPIMENLKIVSKERTERLAWLARIELTEEEKEEFSMQLSRVLESASDLEKLDLAALEPTFHAFEETESLRDDTEKASMKSEDALANAKKTKDGFFVAPRIV
jgi:aspartyl-tRNA(Asn)/glutamyl-tRNA(Gln) amidotransferase subunit C